MKTGEYALPFHLSRLSQWHEIENLNYSESIETSKKINAVIEIEGSYKDIQDFFRSLPQSLKIKSCENSGR